MKVHHKRRKRRQQNMKLRSGGKFKINHNNPAGRTGRVHLKRTPSSKPHSDRFVGDIVGGTGRKVVGVAGFEPATPSSRTS